MKKIVVGHAIVFSFIRFLEQLGIDFEQEVNPKLDVFTISDQDWNLLRLSSLRGNFVKVPDGYQYTGYQYLNLNTL